MPEANILYTVTGVVVAGLVVWLFACLKVAKEPWARRDAEAALAAAGLSKKAKAAADDVPVEPPAASREATAEEKPAEEKPAETKDEQKAEEKAEETADEKAEDKKAEA